jgi:hypothetical protein
VTQQGKPGSKLPSAIREFGKPEDERKAAVSAFGDQLDGIALDVLDDEPVEPTQVAKPPQPAAKPVAKPAAVDKPAAAAKPNLEPVSDDAHKHRRLPTQPPATLQLALDDGPPRPSEPSSAQPSLPPPPKLAPRQSPAPIRMGLLSSDRITNMLGCAAIGLVLMIFPAKQLANNYVVSEVEPMLGDLQGAIEHPLGVEAGLVTKPETIAANIRDGIGKTRTRYALIWLLVGLPIGVGLSFVPRP